MKKRVMIFWSLFLAAAIFRVYQSFTVVKPDISTCLKQDISGLGTIQSEPQRTETSQIIVVSVQDLFISSTKIACAADFLLRLKTKLYPEFSFADQVTFTGKILEPMNFSSGDREFDYQGYLAKDNVFYEMKSAVVKKAEIGSNESNANIDGRNITVHHNAFISGALISIARQLNLTLFSLKAKFVDNLNRTLGEPHAALASGLVVGEKAALGNDLINDFRTVGLIHIVVLSGYNITIVAAAMRRILSFLPRVWGITVGGIGVALFGILVGGGATVIRSCIMAAVALSADLLRRDYSVVRALALAGLVMLIQNPMILLHDTSFQLSFLATLGLLLLAGPLENRLTFIPDKFGFRGIVAATLATQIFVSPFILYTMGQISLIGVAANILILPFIPITMFFVFLTGAIGFIYIGAAQFFAWISHLLLTYELYIVENFARLPFAAAHIAPFSIWWVVGFYVLFLCGYFLFQKRGL